MAVIKRPLVSRGWLLLLLGLLLLVMSSCDVKDLRVEVYGCEKILTGPICEVTAGRSLHLWIQADPAEFLALRQGGRKLTPQSTAAPGSQTLNVMVGDERESLELYVWRGIRRHSWRLALKPLVQPEWMNEASRLHRRGRFDEEEALLVRVLDSHRSTSERARATHLLARIELIKGNRTEQEKRLIESIDLARQAGLTSVEAESVLALASLKYDDGHLNDAQRLLEQARGPLWDYPDAFVGMRYTLGLVAQERGDLRSALHYMEEAATWALRVGNEASRVTVQATQADVLRDMGRFAQADKLLGALLDRATEDPCSRASLLVSQGRGRILASEVQPSTMVSRDLSTPGAAALSLYEEDCPDPQKAVSVMLDLAHAELLKRHPDEARMWLARARTRVRQPGLSLSIKAADLESRAALDQGRFPEALHWAEQIEALARLDSSLRHRWLAPARKAEALEACGRVQEALLAYQVAGQALDERSAALALGAGRGAFLGQFEQVASHHIDLLLRQGRLREAMYTVRRARQRGLRTLQWMARLGQLGAEERTWWQTTVARYEQDRRALDRLVIEANYAPQGELPQLKQQEAALSAKLQQILGDALPVLGMAEGEASLPGPGPGEILLACHPLRQGWGCFAQDQSGVRAVKLDEQMDVPPEVLSRKLLEPLGELIKRAHTMRIISYGAMGNVDLHALPWGGQTLSDRLTVVYMLDIPGGLPRGGATKASRALVVFDPLGDSLRSRQASVPVGQSLRANGWELELRGPALQGEDLKRETLRAVLEKADLFYYAGHVSQESGGLRWMSGNDEAGILATDIFALGKVPRWGVLLGCGTAFPDDGPDLAQAMLARGSEAVVASVRSVSDETAAKMADFMARHGATKNPPDLVSALRQAQHEMRLQGGHADWAAYRAFVR